MTDRATIARSAAAALRSFAAKRDQTPVTIGFDGFVDSIISVVDKRQSASEYDPIPTIDQFGKRIQSAAGKSSNFELVIKLQKLGGNGPIMANALASFGLPVTYIGALGYPEPHFVFQEFLDKADCHSICEPGFTDALEFNDGKLMLGKYEVINDITPERIDEAFGRDAFVKRVGASRLLGMVNWTMLNGMTDIFRMLADEVLPDCGGRPLVFVDLCDPEKRTTEDLKEALDVLSMIQKHTDVALGLNLRESVQVAQCVGVDPTDSPYDAIEQIARDIRAALGLHAVVVHPRETAAAAVEVDGQVQSTMLTGAFTKTPKLSTGAGDNFNAGFCFGLLVGLPVAESVCVGNAASGFYVRNARSANLEELAAFLDDLPEAELD